MPGTSRNSYGGGMSDVGTRVDVDGHYDWGRIVDDLNRLLRLRTTPIGMKRFATVAEMEAVPKIRRPGAVHTTDQIVGQASRNGWTVGITKADLVGDQCAAVVGLHPRDDQWLTGAQYSGVWYSTPDDAAAHQAAMDLPAFGEHEALAVSPLAAGRLDPPDICLIYATPAQMILFINGLQWTGYKKLEWGCVGESSCADSWGRALATGELALRSNISSHDYFPLHAALFRRTTAVMWNWRHVCDVADAEATGVKSTHC